MRKSEMFINNGLRLEIRALVRERQMSVTTRRARAKAQNWHDITRCRVEFNLSPERRPRAPARSPRELKQVVPTHAITYYRFFY